MEKNIINDEIDLSDSLKTIWKNKWKIFSIATITAIISIYFNSNTKISTTSYLSITEILPISSFDNYKYAAYNTYLYKSDYLYEYEIKKDSAVYNNLNAVYNKLPYNFSKNVIARKESLTDNAYLAQIDQVYLFNLFIEKLNQKDLFIEGIKKFNLIKKNDYQNDKDYENAIIRLSNSINIIDKSESVKKKGEVQFQTNNKDNLINILKFIEEAANTEIQNYLKKNFELFILHADREKKYLIEDIDFEISNNLDNEEIILWLNKLKKREQENKNIERLKYLFENTPIIKSDNFIAAKFNIPSTTFKGKTIQNLSMKKVILISLLLGTLLGIFFVLIISNIQKKSELT